MIDQNNHMTSVAPFFNEVKTEAEEQSCDHCGCVFYSSYPTLVKNKTKDKWNMCSQECALEFKKDIEATSALYGENEKFEIK